MSVPRTLLTPDREPSPGPAGSKTAIIAVDAMGGDHAPGAIVRGAVLAAQSLPDNEIILVGDEAKILASVTSEGKSASGLPSNVRIEHTAECVGMHESPSQVLRRKNCSIAVAARLVTEGKASAFFSAGNSGACMAAALKYIGPIEGIDRPAIAAILPNSSGHFLLLDAGANMDCEVGNLLQFALMGSAYASHVLKIAKPRVAIASIGEEDGKGDSLTKSAASIMKLLPIHFIGNVEGTEVYHSKANYAESKVDVIICDGFVGNIILKTSEGAARFLLEMMKREVKKSHFAKIGALLMKPTLRRIVRISNPDEVGGAPLLGVKGVVIIAHGHSEERAICHGIQLTSRSVHQGFIHEIERLLKTSQTVATSKIEAL